MAEKTLNENNVKTMLNKVKSYADTKQSALTFDSTPTASSTNPVTSGGIKTYVDDRFDGASKAISYASYSAMITVFNALADDVYGVGQDIYIVTTNVPDLWVSSVESTSVTYTYVDDATFTSALATNGYVQVGYYRLSALETQKVDLTNYFSLDNTTQNFTGAKTINLFTNSSNIPQPLSIGAVNKNGTLILGQTRDAEPYIRCMNSGSRHTTYYANKIVDTGVNGSNTINIPSQSGTLALTSDIPAQDSTPTANSTNNVTSGGVKSYVDTALRLKQENLYQHNIYMHIDANNSYAAFTITNTSSSAMTATDIANYFNNVVPAGGTIPCNGYLRITQGHVTAGHDFVYRIGGTSSDSTIFTVYTLTTAGAQATISNSTDTLYTAYTYDDTVIPLNPNPTPALPTISFTIAGNSYTAESGMTWGQWVLSAYSNNEYGDDGHIYNILNTRYVNDSYSGLVASSDTITANTAYTLSGGGGD